jgi:hypothetical protein
MYKKRTAAKIDSNQPGIVNQLRQIPGVTVETEKDDILCGYKGRTFWYEIKNPDVANKAGKVFDSAIKPEQKRLLAEWKGHYKIVTTFEEIIEDIGIKSLTD